jgi:predicted O-methyltransferase YrrM
MFNLENTFFQRPRILNQLHRIRLAEATTQTNDEELAALQRHARGKQRLLEIGTYQGVSAARIAKAMSPDGKLWCVDPWPRTAAGENSCMSICMRHLARHALLDRIVFLRGFSGEVRQQIPSDLDFCFVDGDHSWSGIDTDWNIVVEKLAPRGIACLHDVFVPPAMEWRRLDSSRYFQEVIAVNSDFELVDQVCTLAVMRRR